MRKKILYIHHGGSLGGAPQSLLYLIQSIPRDKYEVSIGCTGPSAESFFVNNGIDTQICPLKMFSHTFNRQWHLNRPVDMALFVKWIMFDYAVSSSHLRNKLDIIKPALVHLNSVTLLPYAPVVKKRGIPVVVHIRESVLPDNFNIRSNWLRHLALHQTDALIYICEENRKSLNVDHPKAEVIYNSINFQKFDRMIEKEKTRNTLGIPLLVPVILFPGGSDIKIKGIIPMLMAIKELVESFPDLVCIVAGIDVPSNQKQLKSSKLMPLDGSEFFYKLVKDLGIERHLLKSVFTFQIEKLFAACDVVVSPFVVPHFSRAVIEAGAMAKPVVGSNIGGIAEVIYPWKTGLLAEPGDGFDLARNLKIILQNRQLADKLGEGGYRQALEKFSPDKNVSKVMKIYESLLNKI